MADDEDIAEPKRKRKQKLLVQALKENDSSITKLNQSNSFMKVTTKTKMFKCQKIIQAMKKVTGKFLTFFLVKVLVMFQSEAANMRYSTKISVLQKIVLQCSFSVLMVKSLEKYVWRSSFLVKLQAYSKQL